MRNLRIGSPARRPLDKLRLGLLQLVLARLRALNDNTRRLLHLLEADWDELKASWRRKGPNR
jgi:hypothetical protein